MLKRIENKGLTGFALKIIALVFMTTDHIYSYIGSANVSVPIWFTWLGRIVAPIFIFLSVEGFYYTRSRKKYLSRLYIGFVFMQLANSIVVDLFPRQGMDMALMNSMFGTIFLIVVYLFLVDFIKKGIEEKSIGKIGLGTLAMAAPILLNVLLLIVMEKINPFFYRVIFTLIPLPLTVEGGLFFILLGIIFYLLRERKNLMLISYIIFSAIFLPFGNMTFSGMFMESFQWMMVFAAPLLYLYNREPGKKMKHLFYIYYPAHIYLLYIVGTMLNNKFI